MIINSIIIIILYHGMPLYYIHNMNHIYVSHINIINIFHIIIS